MMKEITAKKKLPISTIIVSLFAIILAIGMAFILINKGEPKLESKVESSSNQKYFNSPETAAEYFVECINLNDYEGVIQAFALDEKITNYDFVAYTDRMDAFTPLTDMAPEYEEYATLNRAYLVNQASQSVKAFIYSFFYKEELSKALLLSQSDYNASNIYKLLNPKKLESLKLDRLDCVSPELQESEKNQDYIRKLEKIYGYTDRKEYFALYELDNEFFYGGFSFVKYKEGWQIDSLYTALGGTVMYGVTPIKEYDYLSMLE